MDKSVNEKIELFFGVNIQFLVFDKIMVKY